MLSPTHLKMKVWERGAGPTLACGTGACLNESSYLAEEIQSATCAGGYAHKVTLVLDGGNINDGTFNQLAYEGAVAGCTAALSCCLEVDRVDDDVEDAATRFFCELEYAAQDSDMVRACGDRSSERAAWPCDAL